MFDADSNFELDVASPALPPQGANWDAIVARSKPRSSPPRTKVVPRKFPGPAGLAVASNPQADVVLCSQRSGAAFELEAWGRMRRDFRSGGPPYLPDVCNIAWIKAQAAANALADRKAPFLAAVLHGIDDETLASTITVLLKDLTGEIKATILYEVFQRHSRDLLVGSVLVLKQFGVLTAGNDHHLTVTAKNLARIYVEKGAEGPAKVVDLQDVSVEDFVRCVEESKRKKTADPAPPSKATSRGSDLNSNSKRPAREEARQFKFRPVEPEKKSGESAALVQEILRDLNVDSFFDDF